MSQRSIQKNAGCLQQKIKIIMMIITFVLPSCCISFYHSISFIFNYREKIFPILAVPPNQCVGKSFECFGDSREKTLLLWEKSTGEIFRSLFDSCGKLLYHVIPSCKGSARVTKHPKAPPMSFCSQRAHFWSGHPHKMLVCVRVFLSRKLSPGDVWKEKTVGKFSVVFRFRGWHQQHFYFVKINL